MASTFQINTYWNVDTLATVFNGVAAIFNSGNYTSLIKLIFILGLGIAILVYAMGRQSDFFKWFLQSYIMVSLLMIPVNTVTIVDVTNQQPPKVVSNVPWTMAALASVSTEVQYWLTKTFETTFGIPDSLNMIAGDIGFGHRILRSVNQISIKEPNLKSDLMQFFKECTIYDVRDGAINPNDLVGKVDTWNLIFSNTSPARFVTYDTLTANPKTDTCTNVANVLKTRVDNGIAASTTYYGKSMFTRATTDAAATSLFVQAVGDSSSWILNNSASTSSIIKQSMFNNIWHEAATEIPAMTGDNARLEQVNAVIGATQAAAQMSGSQNTITLLAQEAIPHMRNWMEAIIYACFPLVVLLILLSPAEAALKILGGYAISIVWLGLIPVMWAVINDLSLLYLKQKMVGLSLVNGGVPFQLSTVYDTTLFNEQSAIGWMIVLTPALAGMFLKLASGGFTSLAGSMMASMNSMGASAGASAALGNNSIGQTSLDNASVNNTSMNKYDSNMGVQGGGLVTDQSNGNTVSVSPGGSLAVREFQNQRAIRDSQSQRHDASTAQLSNTGVSATHTTDKHNNTGLNSTLDRGVGTSNSRGKTQHIDDHSGRNTVGSHDRRFEQGSGIDKTRTANKDSTGSISSSASFLLGGGAQVGGGDSSGSPGGASNNPSNAGRPSRVNSNAAKNNPAKGDKGVSSPGRGKIPLFAHASIATNETSSASTEMRQSSGQTTTDSERTNNSVGVVISGDQGHQEAIGQESSQLTNRTANASLAKIKDTGTGTNAAYQKNASIGDSASRTRTDAFETSRDYLSDAGFINDVVAPSFGMSGSRFSLLPADVQSEKIQEFLNKEGALKATTAMPTETLSNSAPLPTASTLGTINKQNMASVGGNATADYNANVNKIGAGSTEALQPNTDKPAMVTDATTVVENRADPNNKYSIPARSKTFNDGIDQVANLNTPVGAEEYTASDRNAQQQETVIGKTISKGWDSLTGKRQPPPSIQIPTVPDQGGQPPQGGEKKK